MPGISGNKFRKLKYTFLDAHQEGHKLLLSFGGAYSNHIAALAQAAHLSGIRCIGVIRGEELANRPLNPTLAFAREKGMELHFVSREAYRKKESPEFLDSLEQLFGSFYLIPEGGTSPTAVRGCKDIWDSIPVGFDQVCVSVGTGGTMAGLVAGCPYPNLLIKGYSALKGTFQQQLVKQYSARTNFSITDSYCFGGYAKIDESLVRFINTFRQEHGVLLDPVYTAKMMYGILDDVEQGRIPKNTRILAIHTGGLQGIAGMNLRLKRMNLPLIQLQ